MLPASTWARMGVALARTSTRPASRHKVARPNSVVRAFPFIAFLLAFAGQMLTNPGKLARRTGPIADQHTSTLNSLYVECGQRSEASRMHPKSDDASVRKVWHPKPSQSM